MNEMRIDTVLGEMRLLGDSDALAGIYFVGQKNLFFCVLN